MRSLRKLDHPLLALGVLALVGLVLWQGVGGETTAPIPSDAPPIPDLSAGVPTGALGEEEIGGTAPQGPGAQDLAVGSDLEAHRVQPIQRTLPDTVRGIYLNAWAAGSRARRAALLELAEAHGINTFVVDVREAGMVSYRTGIEEIREAGGYHRAIPDPAGLLDDLKQAGVRAVARIVLFRDPVLPAAMPDLAILNQDGELWVDPAGYTWLNPYSQEAWRLLVDIAVEAAELGFEEIQWDYIRFPDAPSSALASAVYPGRLDGEVRLDAVRGFLEYSRERLRPYGVAVTADVFGLVTSASTDLGIGQVWSEISPLVDGILPMVYPSHYTNGSYGIPHPNSEPRRLVRRAMEDAVGKNGLVDEPARIVPWIQAFTLGLPRYGPDEIREQIRGAEEAGVPDWILWNPSSRYDLSRAGSVDQQIGDQPAGSPEAEP